MAGKTPYNRPLKFKITRIYAHGCAKAQRYCLSALYPAELRASVVDDVDNDGLVTSGPSQGIVKATLLVQQQWRGRMALLRGHGWSRLAKQDSWYYALNCPPVGVATNRTSMRCCREYKICPFCWARTYARELYCAVECACYGHNRLAWLQAGLQDHIHEQYRFIDLLTVVDTFLYPMDSWPVQRVLQDPEADKRLLRQAVPAVGAYVLDVLEPVYLVAEGTHFWKRSQRLLAMVDPGQPSPREERTHSQVVASRQVRRFFTATRERIAGAVGVTCAYPVGLMCGPIDDVMALIEARTGTKEDGHLKAGSATYLSAYYGVLRNRQQRKRNHESLQSAIEAELANDDEDEDVTNALND
jgi:hypothetical protein